MHHLIAPAEGRIFVLQAMQDMGIGGEDPREAVLGEQRDIAPGEILEQSLVAEAPGDIAAVELLGADHGEIDLRLAQQPDQAAQGPLAPQLEGGVAQPEQDVGALHIRQPRQGQIRRPVEPAGQRPAAGIVGRLQLGQRLGPLAGRGAELEGLMPAQSR